MGLLRCGIVPSSVLVTAARICVAAPLVLVAGCASTKPSYVHGPDGPQMAATHKVEMEDDGQPVQSPPVRAMAPEEDDPSQPWSPNYGKGGAPSLPSRGASPILPRQMDAAMPVPAKVAFQAAATSVGSVTRLSDAEANDVIARAISAHEMRKQ